MTGHGRRRSGANSGFERTLESERRGISIGCCHLCPRVLGTPTGSALSCSSCLKEHLLHSRFQESRIQRPLRNESAAERFVDRLVHELGIHMLPGAINERA